MNALVQYYGIPKTPVLVKGIAVYLAANGKKRQVIENFRKNLMKFHKAGDRLISRQEFFINRKNARSVSRLFLSLYI